MNQRNYYTVDSLSRFVGRGIWLVSFQFAPTFGTLRKLDDVVFQVFTTIGTVTFRPCDIEDVQEHGSSFCFTLIEPTVTPVVSTLQEP